MAQGRRAGLAPHPPGSASGRGGAEPALPVLHFHGVTVRFSEATVLEGVTFDLPAGRFLAIVGPNGGGKSTLIKVALGLVKPLSGHAALFGDRAGAHPERIGYVPQLKTFDRTFPATAEELVITGLRQSWPARVRPEEAELAAAALERVGARALARRPLARLSGGELQRAYLARALVRRPELVMLDEPATGVDYLAEHDLYDLLESYQADSGATIVMVTHDLSAARYHASKVLVLNRRVHGYGSPDVVMTEECLEQAFGHRHHSHALSV